MSKTLRTILIVLVVIAILLIAFIFYKNSNITTVLAPAAPTVTPVAVAATPSPIVAETASAAAEASVAGELKEVTGTITETTMNNLTIKTTDGQEMNFSTTDAEKETGKDGLLLDEKVAVTYDPAIKQDDNYWTATKIKVLTDDK